MMRLLSALSLLLLPATAHAAYVAPALETEAPLATYHAPFEGEEEGEEGFVILARDTLYGETERRVESCAAFAQAEEEGFTEITENATPFYADWLWVRCTALNHLRDLKTATQEGAAPFKVDVVVRLPALVSEQAACADKIAATKAALRGETWLAFEGMRQGKEEAATWREQPPVQFDLIAASDKENAVLAVSPASADVMRLHLNGATGAVERLAEFDRTGDGIADLLIYISWESPVFGPYRREVMWLEGTPAEAPYKLLWPAKALSKVVATCPDHLSDVIAGPDSLQK